MIRTTLAAAALLLAPITANAQSAQDALDARYDHALAAGYKALMLCGAMANAAENGTTRSAQSVEEWELQGIYPALDPVVAELPYEVRLSDSRYARLRQVEVTWDASVPPRVAVARYGAGCSLLPIGAAVPQDDRTLPAIPPNAPAAFRNVRNDPALASPAASAFSGGYGEDARTTALVVVQGGDEVFEQYAPGFGKATPQRTWSVAKSIAATLVGAAVQRGEVDVQASAGLGLSEHDPRRAITIDNLLRMASGRYSDTPGNRTDPLYAGGATVRESAIAWPLIHPPGTVFRYANNDTLAAVLAIEGTFADNAPGKVLDRLRMHHTVAETDWQGDYILSSQVWSTARDLARLGQLYLDDGVLAGGDRVLPEGWVQYVTTPAGPQPDGAFGYGAGFWLMNRSEGVPADTFAAFGNRGQYVVIVPSREVVIVRRGEDPAGGDGFDIAAFTRDVLAALEK